MGKKGRVEEGVLRLAGGATKPIAASNSRQNARVAKRSVVALLFTLASGCGALTAGHEDVVIGDVVRPPNARWCNLIVADAAVQIEATRGATSVVMCGPDMPVGTRCITTFGLTGECRDFVAESNGYFANYARENRVPRYCWRAEYNACGISVMGIGQSECAFAAPCIRIPNPRPGGPSWMCPPEPCN